MYSRLWTLSPIDCGASRLLLLHPSANEWACGIMQYLLISYLSELLCQALANHFQ